MDQFHVRQLMNLRGLCPVCYVIFCYWGGGRLLKPPTSGVVTIAPYVSFVRPTLRARLRQQ